MGGHDRQQTLKAGAARTPSRTNRRLLVTWVLLAPSLPLAISLGGCPASDQAGAPANSASEQTPSTSQPAAASGELARFEHRAALTEGLRSPARIALAPNGTVLVTDPFYGHIARFAASGSPLPAWPVAGRPLGIAIEPDGGRLFLSMRGEAQVAIYNYDSASDTLQSAGQVLGNGAPAFIQPTDIKISADTGDIYVVDGDADRVFQFDSAGNLLAEIGQRGTSGGHFKYPSAICIDAPRHLVIVADQDNWRVQVLDPSGRFLGMFGERTKGFGPESVAWLPRPQGLAVDPAGNIYVADALMGAVRVFDPAGTDLGKAVDYGDGADDVRTPSDLAVSADGTRLYVVSTSTSCVQVYGIPAELPQSGNIHTWDGSSAGPPEEPLPGRSPEWEAHQSDGQTVCKRCHGLTGQPGGSLGTPQGQVMLCLSCHNAVGQALATPMHPLDVADPYGANPSVADARGISHAWSVPAVNPAAGAVGPTAGGPMEHYLASGLIKCTTCHNPHDSRVGAPYMRVNNAHDAMCKECHTGRNARPGQSGNHPVGLPYPGPRNEFPAASALALPLESNWLECTTCHAVHAADSGHANQGAGDGLLLRAANDGAVCQACHTQHTNHPVRGDWQPTCTDCHAVHDPGNPNLALVARQIRGRSVSFLDRDHRDDGRDDFVHADRSPAGYNGVCQICHTATAHYRNAPGSDDDHFRSSKMICTDCHQHRFGFIPYCVGCHTGGSRGPVK